MKIKEMKAKFANDRHVGLPNDEYMELIGEIRQMRRITGPIDMSKPFGFSENGKTWFIVNLKYLPIGHLVSTPDESILRQRLLDAAIGMSLSPFKLKRTVDEWMNFINTGFWDGNIPIFKPRSVGSTTGDAANPLVGAVPQTEITIGDSQIIKTNASGTLQLGGTYKDKIRSFSEIKTGLIYSRKVGEKMFSNPYKRKVRGASYFLSSPWRYAVHSAVNAKNYLFTVGEPWRGWTVDVLVTVPDQNAIFARMHQGDRTWQDDIEKFTDEEAVNKLNSDAWKDQIVAFRGKNSGRIYTKNEDGKWCSSEGVLNYMNTTSMIKDEEIYTVKNSRGELWSVGDEAKEIFSNWFDRNSKPTNTPTSETYVGKISSFNVVENTLRYNWIAEGGQKVTNGFIDDIKKPHRMPFPGVQENMGWPTGSKEERKPLFTTEDGVEVFEGDDIFSFNPEPIWGRNILWSIKATKDAVDRRCFSTEAAAGKWMEENKPSISYRQLESVCKSLAKYGYPGFDHIVMSDLLNHFKPKP